VKLHRMLMLATATLLSAGLAAAAEKGNPAWEKLKTLAGDWEAETSMGKSQISYKVVSGGSALMETIREPNGTEMVTVFHPDGDRLLMTHYCSLGNQPRMRADGLSDGGKKVAFSYLDASNLSSPEAMHMARMVVNFGDADHFTESWTLADKGKEQIETFKLTRRK
jgi:hypothetical protein